MLPDYHQATLANLGETLEALVVRRSESQPFARANEECKMDEEPNVVGSEAKSIKFSLINDKQVRITVTNENISTWLCDHHLVSFGMPLSPENHATLTETLRVSAGDTVWLSRRRAVPEVC